MFLSICDRTNRCVSLHEAHGDILVIKIIIVVDIIYSWSVRCTHCMRFHKQYQCSFPVKKKRQITLHTYVQYIFVSLIRCHVHQIQSAEIEKNPE